MDLEALADPKAAPGLLVSATDVEAGEIAYFDSHDKGLPLDHIVASGSLPPWDAWSPCSRANMRAAWISARPARSPKGSLAPKCVHDSQEGIVMSGWRPLIKG